MAHVSRRGLAAMLAGILSSILAAGCGGSSGNAGPAAESQQVLYRTRLLEDYRSLDRGILAYSQVGNLNTADTIQFEVSVIDIGRGPQLTRLTEFAGMTVYQQDVPTGAIVGVQIVACHNLTCASESDLRQAVLAKGQQARWFWSITAGTPGPALIVLRADTYDQDSAQSLKAEIISINVNVLPTAAFNHQQNHKKIANAANSVVRDIETTGSVATAVVAVGGIVGWIVVKRRKPKAKNPAGGGGRATR